MARSWSIEAEGGIGPRPGTVSVVLSLAGVTLAREVVGVEDCPPTMNRIEYAEQIAVRRLGDALYSILERERKR